MTNKLTHTRNSLPEKCRTQVVSILQSKLADAIDLMMQAKQAHWNVKGPHFMALHQLFDHVFQETQKSVDLIAERIMQLGGKARGTVRAASNESSLPEYSLDISNGVNHIAELAHALSFFGDLLRSDILSVTELGDVSSADILTEIARRADLSLWFLEAHEQTKK